MYRLGKWFLLALLLAGLLVGAGLFALQRWIGTDAFKAPAKSRLGAATGVAVQLGRIEVGSWLVPALALVALEIQTRPALTIERVEARLGLSGLLAGRLELATLVLRRANLPQAGIDQLLASLIDKPAVGASPEPRQGGGPPVLMPRRIVFDAVAWQATNGDTMTLDADAHLSPQGLPERLMLKVLEGQAQGARLQLARKGLVWDFRVDHAGGTVTGQGELANASATGVEVVLKGRFETKDVEISALGLKASNASIVSKAGAGARVHPVSHGPLSGRLDASTTISARAASMGAVLDVLQTQSKFTARNAVVHGIDLARAVKTVGLSRGGETRLDTLAGQLNTKGRAISLNSAWQKTPVFENLPAPNSGLEVVFWHCHARKVSCLAFSRSRCTMVRFSGERSP